MIKGIEFGDLKVRKWVSSLIISLFSSIFLTQPVKAVLLGIFFVLIFRKPKHHNDLNEDEIKLENEQINEIDFEKNKNVSIMKNDKDLDKIELHEARKKILQQLKFKIALREFVTHLVFLSLIYINAFAFKDNYSFRYQKALRSLFLGPTFDSMTNTEQFWFWARQRLSIGLRAQPWYNGNQPYNLAGFLNDYSSRMIGYGILRQLRVKEGIIILK